MSMAWLPRAANCWLADLVGQAVVSLVDLFVVEDGLDFLVGKVINEGEAADCGAGEEVAEGAGFGNGELESAVGGEAAGELACWAHKKSVH